MATTHLPKHRNILFNVYRNTQKWQISICQNNTSKQFVYPVYVSILNPFTPLLSPQSAYRAGKLLCLDPNMGIVVGISGQAAEGQ